MLFRREILDGIAAGRVTLAFRRWKRATVKARGRVHTAAGVVQIGEVQICDPKQLKRTDARRAGFATLDALLGELGPDNGGQVYRLELNGIEPDERAALRSSERPTDAEWEAIKQRFAKWERVAPGHFPVILATIAEHPEVAAAELAGLLKLDKLKFKQDVRKLKELGLTESLHVGYRLSGRGATVLRWFQESNVT